MLEGKKITDPKEVDAHETEFKNCDFLCDFEFPHIGVEDVKTEVFRTIAPKLGADKIPKAEIKVQDCYFRKQLKLNDYHDHITFTKCEFEGNLIAEDSKFEGKVRFRECDFIGDVNFRNATFEELADFWRSTFYEQIIFYKTDFLGTAVFSAATFKQNVLFTYTLIEKLLLFRGTKFNKGLDLSLANLSGSVGVFDISLIDFLSLKGKLTDEEFEDAVSSTGEIPIKNKRETYRILKGYHETNNNHVESIPFRVLEKKTLNVEQRLNLFRARFLDLTKEERQRLSEKEKDERKEKIWPYIIEKFRAVFNLIVLFLNWLSNYYGAAYMQGIIFTLGVGGLFFYFLMLSTPVYEFGWFDLKILYSNIPNYATFLLPTHKFDFLGPNFLKKSDLSNWFYFWDISGRIFIGYGIYQTVQAFRKFK